MAGSAVSIMPARIDCERDQASRVCSRSQLPAGPWHASQLTPYAAHDAFSVCGTSRGAWHSRHCSAPEGASGIPSRREISSERSSRRTLQLLACRSRLCQVVYSFCRETRLSPRFVALPWQFRDAQAPGPTYCPASPGAPTPASPANAQARMSLPGQPHEPTSDSRSCSLGGRSESKKSKRRAHSRPKKCLIRAIRELGSTASDG
jgi:hypothetical protein